MPTTTSKEIVVPRAKNGEELVAPELIYKQLERMKPEMEAALPRHMNPDRMARIALTVLRENPELFKCTKDSFLGCLMKASSLGLEPGIMGQCYFIPFWNEKVGAKIATFVPGWKGLLDLVKRTERATATSRGIFDGDEYDYAFGDRPFIHHKPGPNYGDPKALIMTYAVGWTHGAEYPEIDVWSIERVWKHRDAQMKRTGAKTHYSFEHPEMYARKIPLLQVIKYLPTSIELMTAQVLEGQAELGTQRVSLLEGLTGASIEAEVKEAKVAQLMQQLEWDDAKRNDFQAGYAGRTSEAIEYLEAEVAKRAGAKSKAPTKAEEHPQQDQGKTAVAPEVKPAAGGAPEKPEAERTPSAPAKAGFWE